MVIPLLLEVIVSSVDDAVAATEGGADRLEVVRDILVGGLTPSLSLVRAIQAATSLPLRVMVRENAGFTTSAAELPALQRAAAGCAALSVDGVVLGFARDGAPALEDLARVLEAAPDVAVTFHRAFDSLRSPLAALDAIAAIPQVDRILTSGGAGTARERSARLRLLSERADRGRPGISILAGGGVDDQALALFAAAGCVREAHVGRAARADNTPDGPVSASRVRELRQLAGSIDRR